MLFWFFGHRYFSPRLARGLFLTPDHIEFKTKFHCQRFNVKKYVEAQAILRLGSMIFMPKHFFFHNRLLHTEVHKTSEHLVHLKGCTQKKIFFWLISSMSMSKQPEKPCGARLFKLCVILSQARLGKSC